jgi:hypothetical protein
VQPVRIPGASSPLQFPPTITEGDPGMGETVDTDHQFGRTLGALNGRSENILTISSPFTDTGAIPNPSTDTGVVYVLSDGTNVAPRSWLPQAGAGRFGWAVSN